MINCAILDGVLSRIRNEQHWCRRFTARDQNGNPVWPVKPEAIRWSLTGALYKEIDHLRDSKIYWPNWVVLNNVDRLLNAIVKGYVDECGVNLPPHPFGEADGLNRMGHNEVIKFLQWEIMRRSLNGPDSEGGEQRS